MVTVRFNYRFGGFGAPQPVTDFANLANLPGPRRSFLRIPGGANAGDVGCLGRKALGRLWAALFP